jgi:hypothetical protein
MNTIARSMLAAAAALGLAAFDASATDITVVNASANGIHPYFRSNCWMAGVVTTDANGWANFGGIGAHGQFTWSTFETLLDPSCAHPRLDFAYSDASYASPAPPKNPRADRILRMDFSKLGASQTITLVNPLPTILDGDHDDD